MSACICPTSHSVVLCLCTFYSEKFRFGSLKSETSDFWIIVSWQGFRICWFGGCESDTGRAVLARPRHVAIWLPHKSWFGTESINVHVNTSTFIDSSSVILLISLENLQQSWLGFSVELKPGSADDSRSVDRPCDLTVDEQQTEVDFLSTQLFLSFPWPQLQYLSQGLMEFYYLSRWHCGRLQSHLLCLEVTSATWMIQLLLCSRMYLFSKWMPTPLVTHRY